MRPDDLVRAIEIFGEAASRLSPEARKAMPGWPWPAIIAMRNRLGSRRAATEDIPALLPLLVAALYQN